MLGEKRKGGKSVRTEKREKEDWTVLRGEETDKCVVVEEKVDGTRRMITRNVPTKKQIWSWGKVMCGKGEKEGCNQLVLFDSGNLSRSLVSIGLIRKLEKLQGRKIKIKRYDTAVKG